MRNLSSFSMFSVSLLSSFKKFIFRNFIRFLHIKLYTKTYLIFTNFYSWIIYYKRHFLSLLYHFCFRTEKSIWEHFPFHHLSYFLTCLYGCLSARNPHIRHTFSIKRKKSQVNLIISPSDGRTSIFEISFSRETDYAPLVFVAISTES